MVEIARPIKKLMIPKYTFIYNETEIKVIVSLNQNKVIKCNIRINGSVHLTISL
jgi:hypothetical protein